MDQTPPQQPGWPPQQTGWPPQQPGWPPQQPGWPPQQTGWPPQQPGWPPQQPMSPWGNAIPDGSSMQRKRRPIVLAIGLAMILASFAMIALGIVRLVDAATIPEDEVVSRGTAGTTLRFEHDGATSAQFTIYIESNSSTSSVVDRQVSRISCLVELSDGTTRTVSGANQSTSTQINGTASIGTFTATSGQVSVSCEASDNTPYNLMIATGGPRLPLSAFGLVFGGVGVLLVGIVLTIIGAIRRTIRVPAPT